MTSTGMEGPASLIRCPWSLIIARTRPNSVLETKASPSRRVPSWMRTVATGPRPRSSFASMITPRAGRSGSALSSMTSACRRIISSSSSIPCFFFAETSQKIVSPPHSSDKQVVFRQGLADLPRIGAGFVDLVDGHDNGNSGHPGMVDGFHGLAHDAVIGGHDQNDDIRHLGPSGPHGRKGLMTRRIEKDDVPALDVDMIGADGLGDPARLAVDHIGLADRVQKRRLAVIDMTHDRHDRRPRLQIFRRGFRSLKGFVTSRSGRPPPDIRNRRRSAWPCRNRSPG